MELNYDPKNNNKTWQKICDNYFFPLTIDILFQFKQHLIVLIYVWEK